MDAVKVPEKDLNRYDRIGFASGIYYSKFHQAVLNFAAVNMPQNKQTFFISTYGGKADYTSIEKALTAKTVSFWENMDARAMIRSDRLN